MSSTGFQRAGDARIEASELAELLDNIAARKAFQPIEPGPIERLRIHVAELLGRAWEWISGQLSLGGSGWSWVLWLVGAALLSLAIWMLVLVVQRRPRKRAVAGTPRTEQATVDPFALETRELGRARERGDLHAALHHLYRATLFGLSSAGVLPYRSDRTPEEVARALGPGPRARAFRSLAAQFLPVAFGGRSANAQHFESMLERAKELGVEFPGVTPHSDSAERGEPSPSS